MLTNEPYCKVLLKINNFDPYNVFLAIAINIHFVVQGHI